MPKRAAPKTASKADRREPFALGDRVVHAGTSVQIELPIARMPYGSAVDLPTVVVHGEHPGPTVWLSAAIHGDELNGIEIIRRILRRLDAETLRGTVLAVPIVNVFGVLQESRYLPDRRDLNRSFPGSPAGSLAARLAHIFFDSVALRCSVGIDFHTGSNGRANLPQVRCDLDDDVTRRLALAFAAPLALHANHRDGSLRAAAAARGIGVVLFEGGEAHRFDERAIEEGVDGALRVLGHLEMIDDVPRPPHRDTVMARKSRWVRASRSGFCQLEVDLGTRVDKGEVMAYIADGSSSKRIAVRAPAGGVVIGALQTAMVHRGDAIANLAEA